MMTMPRFKLAHRIIAAFVGMTVAVALTFSATLLIAVDYAEQQLVTESMERELAHLLEDDDPIAINRLQTEHRLFDSNRELGPAPPPWLDALPSGLHEYSLDHHLNHVLVRKIDNRQLALLADLTDFERREEMIQIIVGVSFVVSVLLSAILGTLISRKVMRPVVDLAERVRKADALGTKPPDITGHFAHDEIGELAGTFETTILRLQESLARERLFTSDISHELRNPLMVVASSCEIMKEDPHASATGHKQTERIARACIEMQELVDTMLQLARRPDIADPWARKTTLKMAVEEQVARAHALAEQRHLGLGIRIESDNDHRYPAALLGTVLSNLIRNALHYTDEGRVDVVIRRTGFSVIDTGAGIPAEHRDQLFTPFFRGDTSRSDGIGIGLSLIKRICNHQGWSIELADRPDLGCEFKVETKTV